MHTDNDTIQTREFTVSIACDGAAFDDAMTGPELARILMALAIELRECGDCEGYSASLRDFNGNTCGTAVLTVQDYRR